MKYKVSIVSECHSENLGDQAIARSLSNILCPYYRVTEVSFSTLPDSPAFQSMVVQEKQKSPFRIFIGKVPGKLKARIRWHVLGEKKMFSDHFSRSLEGSDFVILGGGQLIKNNVSLFCEKLSTVAKVSRDCLVPFSFIGIGVDKKMNALTWLSADKAIKKAEFIIFRDFVSRQRVGYKKNYEDKCCVLPDLAFAIKNPNLHRKRSGRRIDLAINCMSLKAMLNHFGYHSLDDAEIFIAGLCGVVKAAQGEGATIVLFTSGASEDLDAANVIRTEVYARVGVDLLIFHPATLDDLLDFLVDVAHVIATRMHAGILAYISGCNPLCINWDDKVEGVWSAIHQKERVVDIKDFDNEDAGVKVLRKLKSLKPATRQSLDDLAEYVCSGVLEPISKTLVSFQEIRSSKV